MSNDAGTRPDPEDSHAYERGMILDIFQPTGPDASNGGVSARCTQVTVLHVVNMTGGGAHTLWPVPAECRVFAPTDDRPGAVLVLRTVMGEVLAHVAPITEHSVSRLMMGGSYVGTSDSRWSRFVEDMLGHPFYGALALHDRSEG